LSISDDSGFKPRRDHGAGRELVFVRNVSEVADRLPDLEAHYGPMAATDFVPGLVDIQIALHLPFDRNSELIEFFALRKLRQWPAGSGLTAAATSTRECEKIEQMLPLFRHLRWRGRLEIELRRDARTGAACVLEVNPRFPGTLPFSHNVGVDLPGALIGKLLFQVAEAMPGRRSRPGDDPP
jgi:predicted ATP-grasp superfamily ATP-dependent carboligase